MRQNSKAIMKVRGLVLPLILIMFICCGCSAKEQPEKVEAKDLYHVSAVNVPEDANRIEDMQFCGDDILLATDTVKDGDEHIIRLYRGASSGKEWAQLYEESFAPDKKTNLLDYSVAVTLGEDAMVIIGQYSFGASVENSTDEIAFAKLYDLKGNYLRELKVPETTNADNVKLGKSGTGFVDIIVNPNEAGEGLSQIVELDANTGEYEKIIDNPMGYDYDVIDDIVYIEDHCYNTAEKREETVPDTLTVMWKNHQEWYEDDLNLESNNHIIWDITKDRNGIPAGITLDDTGVYLYAEKEGKVCIGDAPGELLSMKKDYTYTNIYAKNAEDFYVPFNDETYWGGLKLYHYTKES